MTDYAAVVQRGINELLSLRESNKQLLEALRAIDQMAKTETFFGHRPGNIKAIIATCDEAIRKAEEQS